MRHPWRPASHLRVADWVAGVMHDGSMDHSLQPDHLTDAGQRLVRTVDGFRGDDWSAPSLLPDWSRAHVVAHLALNGEALGGVLRGAADGEPVPMYPSQDARDTDIADLAAGDHAELRGRLLASLTTFEDAVVELPEEKWSGRFARTDADDPSFPLNAVPLMRVREIEVHHADLGAGYAADQWPTAFAETVVEGMVRRLDPETPFRVTPLDSEKSWDVGDVGDDAPVVTGPVAQVAWWLTGREPGDQVTCSRGVLPTIGAW